jgi:hypothetical protein
MIMLRLEKKLFMLKLQIIFENKINKAGKITKAETRISRPTLSIAFTNSSIMSCQTFYTKNQ